MSKEKQIDEMAREIYENTDLSAVEVAENIAEHLYNAGYRKQEWISVEDRVPEEFVSVLGFMTDAGDFPPVRECYLVGKVFFFPSLKDIHRVSHWMELPEPPKGD